MHKPCYYDSFLPIYRLDILLKEFGEEYMPLYNCGVAVQSSVSFSFSLLW